ncbi:MAG: hypothetical protein MUO88_24345 [Desulfobacterales bacterium]|nr:hypothetical protein [Desulfobacterales bacterium]
MKISELLKIVDESWVKKPKGFRVRFQKLVESEFITDFIPDEDAALFDSDVVAWRAAWKLAQSTKSDKSKINEGDIVNIYVVDDSGNLVKYYATNQFEIFNQVSIKA